MRGRALLFIFLVGCARKNDAPPIVAIEIAQTKPTGSSREPAPPKGPCVVRGTMTTLDLKVHAGEETIDLRISKLPTESELVKESAALVHVGGPIRFDGRIALADTRESSEPSLHVTRTVTVLGGLVTVGKGVEVLRPRRFDDAASATAMIGGLEVEGVLVPCDALVIDVRATGASTYAYDEEREIPWVASIGDSLSVCSSPALTTCVTTHDMLFEDMKRVAGFVEVRAAFEDGSEVHGWVKDGDVKHTHAPTPMGYGASGGCGCGRRMLPHLGVGKPDPREHFGKARLKKGSQIYALPELRGEWATVAEDVVIDIQMHRSEDYARVTDLPGIMTSTGCDCPGIDDHAFVKREAVVPIR